MNKESIQRHCEVLENLLERDVRKSILTVEEFTAINLLLFELQGSSLYELPVRYK